jgi:hypothetical protein
MTFIGWHVLHEMNNLLSSQTATSAYLSTFKAHGSTYLVVFAAVPASVHACSDTGITVNPTVNTHSDICAQAVGDARFPTLACN